MGTVVYWTPRQDDPAHGTFVIFVTIVYVRPTSRRDATLFGPAETPRSPVPPRSRSSPGAPLARCARRWDPDGMTSGA